MRTLNQITGAVRRGEEVTDRELRMAVCAYDKMCAQFNLAEQPDQLAQYFEAAEANPEQYVGLDHSPDNPTFVKWYSENVNNAVVPILSRALELVARETIGKTET
jgi:hypothetical protein